MNPYALKSIIVPEFGGIDHLPDSLDELRAFQQDDPGICNTRASEGAGNGGAK